MCRSNRLRDPLSPTGYGRIGQGSSKIWLKIMQIIEQYPPVYERILKAGMKPGDNVIYTYGENIYNPNKLNIPDYLLVHEGVHAEQQGDDPDKWWDRYLKDTKFRLDQELEAYGKQLSFICKHIKDRNKRDFYLRDIATFLSSDIYGKMVSYNEVYNMLKGRCK